MPSGENSVHKSWFYEQCLSFEAADEPCSQMLDQIEANQERCGKAGVEGAAVFFYVNQRREGA